jgi:hypothetical protein
MDSLNFTTVTQVIVEKYFMEIQPFNEIGQDIKRDQLGNPEGVRI